MGDVTKIGWTDATFNPWIGCTKVGPGCDHCYAEAQDSRWGNSHWGTGVSRRRTTASYWRDPIRWNKKRADGEQYLRPPKLMPGSILKDRGTPVPLWVFCGSMCDVFDNEVPSEWRADLWALIRATPHLRWQLVTKRVGNVAKMRPPDWFTNDLPPPGHAYRHVGIIATMVNQEEWDRDAEKLVNLKTMGFRWIGASVEPMLGPIHCGPELGLFDWIICGGESRQKGEAREFNLFWASDLLRQCKAAEVPFFMKQAGSRPVWPSFAGGLDRYPITGPGTVMAEWPEPLRVQQMPRVYECAA